MLLVFAVVQKGVSGPQVWIRAMNGWSRISHSAGGFDLSYPPDGDQPPGEIEINVTQQETFSISISRSTPSSLEHATPRFYDPQMRSSSWSPPFTPSPIINCRQPRAGPGRPLFRRGKLAPFWRESVTGDPGTASQRPAADHLSWHIDIVIVAAWRANEMGALPPVWRALDGAGALNVAQTGQARTRQRAWWRRSPLNFWKLDFFAQPSGE